MTSGDWTSRSAASGRTWSPTLVLDPPVPGDHASTRVDLRVYSKKGLFGGGLAAKAADQIWEALGDTSL